MDHDGAELFYLYRLDTILTISNDLSSSSSSGKSPEFDSAAATAWYEQQLREWPDLSYPSSTFQGPADDSAIIQLEKQSPVHLPWRENSAAEWVNFDYLHCTGAIFTMLRLALEFYSQRNETAQSKFDFLYSH